MTIMANYTNSLGKNDSILHYYRIEYGNRFWRWLFKKDAIESFKDIAAYLGVPIRNYHDYRIIYGNTSNTSNMYTTRIFLDKKE
jgi:hypothetical protein